jgi:hypothetical protein
MRKSIGFWVGVLGVGLLISVASAEENVRRLEFDGVMPEHRLTLKEIDPSMPADWTDWSYLVMDVRTTTPQRFSLWVYTDDGPRRIMLHPFGQGVWLRMSIPLAFLKGRDQVGHDLASAGNRRANSFWMMLQGPIGPLKSVQAIGLAMEYPINKPVIEVQGIHLSKQDEGSEFLEKGPLVDEFGQWANVDWPGKIHSREQLEKELSDETTSWGPGDFRYDEFGGYTNTQAKATGFFRVEEVKGRWWFVDPKGHLFLSTGVNGVASRFGGTRSAATQPDPAIMDRIDKRLLDWGMTTGGRSKPYTAYVRWPREQVLYLGLPDVYSDAFAKGVDEAAAQQCTAKKDDPLLLGYFVGNEPPWPGRESDVVDMILAGPDSAIQKKLKDFLAGGDTPTRRKDFVVAAFEKYISLLCDAIHKYDPNHLTLGIRFGGSPSDEVLRVGRLFDVCSVNVYEYEPTRQIEHLYRVTGRPILIGEFHIGVPANGLAAGLVQAMNQTERGNAYRYFMEQGAALPCFVGAHWFQWRDEPVLGRMDGENYNIGFVDATDRPYRELVDAAKETHRRLMEVHAGMMLPFNQRPKASEAATPSSAW